MVKTEPIRLRPQEVDVQRKAFGRPTEVQERMRLIVDAAANRFESQGFHGTSLQDIADDVGITKAALYHYFDSKEQLLYLIHDAFVATMLDAAEEFIADHDEPEEQLAFLVHNIFNTVAAYRPYVRAFFRDYGVLEGDLERQIREKRDRYESLLEQCIATGIKKSVFRADLDPRMTALMVFGACNWSYQWLQPDGAMSADQLADSWYSMLIQGLGATKVAKSSNRATAKR